MKKLLLLATSALLLLAGCAKQEAGLNGTDGDLQTVTFTASMDDGTATKAAADGDGAAANVNRCIMEIYYDGSLFERKYAEVTGKVATFSTQLVANRTYKVAFWADSIASRSALSADLYYTTNAAQPNGGLQAIALNNPTAYVGNNDARDAFFSVDDYTIAQGGTACVATLKRPFAQVNVITTDWDKVSTVSTLKPDKVDVTIQNPLTKFNALTGVASADASVTSLIYNADLYTAPAPVQPVSTTDKTLSMDYLFASAEKAVIDINWKAQKTDNTDVAHSFTNIPYQRNYRTNIKGNLLTSTGQWTVTVDPIWESSKTGEEEYEYVVVGDIKSANEEIASQLSSGRNTINVKFTSQPNDAGTPGSTSTEGIICNSILTTNLPKDATLNILVEAQTKDLYIGDYISETSQEVNTSEVNGAVVNINIPANSSIQKLVVNAPSKTVYVNGIEVASGGVVDLDAITSQNTLIIAVGQAVGTLTMRQGGLEIHGTVNAVTIPEGHGAIYVRACEGLSSTVYGILEPYIDIDNGYVGEQESGKETYRVYQKAESECVAQIDTTKYYTLNAAVNAATTGQTIELIKNVPAPAESKGDIYLRFADNVTVDLEGYSINSGIIAPAGGWDYTKGNAYIFEGNGMVIKGGTINGVERSDGYGYGLYIGNDEDGNIATSDVTVQDVVFPNGGINIYNATDVTVKDCDVTVQPTSYYSVYVCGAGAAASVTINGGTYRPGTNGYVVATDYESSASIMSITAGTFTGNYLVGDNTTLSITGGTYSVDPSAYVADGYEAVKEGDVWVVSTIKVAKIGETKYETLASAFEAVQDGQTIELLHNCSLTASTTVDNNLTLDLKTLTLTSNVSGDYLFKIESGKNFTLTNGSVTDGTEGAATGLIQPTAATVVVSDVNFGTFNTAGTANILFPMTGNTSLTLTDVTVTTNNNVVKTSGQSNTLIVTNGNYTDTKRNNGTHTFDLLEYDTSSALFDGVTITSPDAAERQSCIETDATKGTSNIVLKNCTIKAEYGNTVYAAADMTIINCDIETADNANNAYHAVSVETEHTLNIYGGTYKGSTKANSAALKIWTSGGTIKVYDKYNEETLPVVIEGTYLFYIDSNNKGEAAHTAEVYFEGDSIQTKGQWAQQHIAKAYVKGGYHDCTVWYGSNANSFILSGGTYTMDPRTNNCFKIADGHTVVANGGTPGTWSVKPTTPTTGTTPDLGDWK